MLSIARRSIEVEVTTLRDLHDSLDASFYRSLEIIHASSGRVICTGVGKSSLIAQKMVATFNSTGTPAIFMHAADAIHGDLGILQSGDVVIFLSKSGQSEELLRLVPIIKKMGLAIISIVANAESALALASDQVILTPIRREAEPNDLAPTASAVSQLAVGDALAACMITAKGFRSNDFANLHPGGTLGKRLHLRVADVAKFQDPPLVSVGDAIKKVIIEISSKRFGATAVVDKHHQLCGIITDGDLRRMLENRDDWTQLQARDIMTRSPKEVDKNALAIDALTHMHQFNITQLVITEQGKYIGIVHIHEILKEGLG